MPHVRQKPHRLPEAAYVGHVTVSFTACLENRQRYFTNIQVVHRFVEVLAAEADKFRCHVPIYCFMPDHLHVLLEGYEEDSRPKLAMGAFKQKTSLILREISPDLGWQRSFYDHIIRKSEDWRQHVMYIAANPVRAGLVEVATAYPLTGSLGYDLKSILHCC